VPPSGVYASPSTKFSWPSSAPNSLKPSSCHSRTVLSAAPVAMVFLSGEKARHRTGRVWPLSLPTSLCVSVSQKLTWLTPFSFQSPPPTASSLPSCENARQCQRYSSPSRRAISLPVVRSHSLTVLASVTVATVLLSGENAIRAEPSSGSTCTTLPEGNSRMIAWLS